MVLIYFFHGPDTYRSRRAFHEARDEFLKKSGGVFPVVFRFDAEEDSPEGFIRSVRDEPFLGGGRLFILERVFTGPESTRLLLKPFFDGWARDTRSAFLFWDTESGDALSGSKVLSFSTVKVKKFAKLSGEPLRQWLDDACTARGLALSAGEKRVLLSGCAGDLWRLSGELSRREVGGELTREAGPISQEKVWDFTDSLLVSKRRALASAVRLADDGVHELQLLGFAGKMLRNVCALHDAGTRGDSLQVVAEKLDIHPFVARKLMHTAKGKSLSVFVRQYLLLCEADKNIKTGQLPDSLAFLNIFVR